MSTRQRRKMQRKCDLAIARGWHPGLSVRDVLRPRTTRQGAGSHAR